MIAHLWQRAARGDVEAQRAGIDASLEFGRLGISDWRSATEHALFFARMAYWNTGSSDDLHRVVQAINLCVQSAKERGDLLSAATYSAEFAARVDELADMGDERAIAAMSGDIAKLDLEVLGVAKLLRNLWDEPTVPNR